MDDRAQAGRLCVRRSGMDIPPREVDRLADPTVVNAAREDDYPADEVASHGRLRLCPPPHPLFDVVIDSYWNINDTHQSK